MQHFKYKKKINISLLKFIVPSIILLSCSFLIYINVNITPKYLNITDEIINVYNNQLIMDFISADALTKNKLSDLIQLVKNSQEQIVAIDYNVENSYKILAEISAGLKDGLTNINYDNFHNYNYDVKDGLVLYFPLGMVSNLIYFNNLGPKVPVKIDFLTSLTTGLQTKVTNYGINNVLIEMYLNISIQSNVIIPATNKNLENNYNVLLSAKVVVGQVPSYLNGTIENSTAQVTS